MQDVQPRELQFYRTPNGREPFAEWFNAIRDPRTRTRIQRRLVRLEGGNFGDCHAMGNGVFELRLHFGTGYRIYFSNANNMIVLVLCGGDKSTQSRDIERAKTYWLEYKETQS
jgi:putative addiction module killer protein